MGVEEEVSDGVRENPDDEIRNPKQIPNPKGTRCVAYGFRIRLVGDVVFIRIWSLGFVSDFVIRISDLLNHERDHS